MRLLITRPEEDGERLKAVLEEMGHRVTSAPLLRIEFAETALDLSGVDALIATSRNGIRALQNTGGLARAAAMPIYVVGPATGELARAAGFQSVIEGPASARELVPLIAGRAKPGARLLHLAGDKLAVDLKGALEDKGLSVRRETVYQSVAAGELDAPVASAIRRQEIDGVILMSPRTAKIFSNLAIKADLKESAGALCYFCLSDAVVQGLADLSPRRVYVARLPNTQEVLALVARVAPDFA